MMNDMLSDCPSYSLLFFYLVRLVYWWRVLGLIEWKLFALGEYHLDSRQIHLMQYGFFLIFIK